ncbi:6-bladed beta-propeller [Parabacteroides sp. PF5-6]|uniref:6-bladed beta-propeller n=1 Tax=Parabacteroides sp. PF5-6 TaxID=1742403 RepID=UPI002405A9C4|nr:6-bladed beta-propeller [Parabacteroides sp. PF5-6]MDF9830535.1 hypothetical protein [Parabacteroides sp. PF5-6]
MKKNKSLVGISLLFALLVMGCAKSKDVTYWENAPVVAERSGELITLDPALLKDTIVFPLSFFAEELQIVKLDDREDAFVYPSAVLLSDNYILVQSGRNNNLSFEEWQASVPMPCRLFDKTGKYITDIGSIGQGPGEYNDIYAMQIDEAADRIYLLPWQSDKLLVYSLKGEVLEPIRLPYRANKGVFRVEGDRVTMAVLPFPQIPSVAWTQTLDGKVLNEIPVTEALAMEFDFSNEISSYQHAERMDLSFWYWPTRIDTLYHIDADQGQLIPRFTVKFKENKLEPHSYAEWPNYYAGNTSTIVTISDGNSLRQEGEKPAYYIVDKETLRGAFFRVVNDYMGGEDMDWPFMLFEKGYYARNMDPGNLEEWLEKALKSKTMSDAVRERLTTLRQSIGPDDNNYVVYARMKR